MRSLRVAKPLLFSFVGASVAHVIKMMEYQKEDQLDTLKIMIGTQDISRAPVTPEWEPSLVCLLNKLKQKYKPRLVVLCTVPQNAKGRFHERQRGPME